MSLLRGSEEGCALGLKGERKAGVRCLDGKNRIGKEEMKESK